MGANGVNLPDGTGDESAQRGEEPEKPGESNKEESVEKAAPSLKMGLLKKTKSFIRRRLPRKAWIFFGVSGMLLLLVGLGFIFKQKGAEKKQNVRQMVEIEPRFHESFFSLSPFFVPISSGDRKERFVWIRIALQLNKGEEDAVRSELSGLRSTVFNVLGRKRLEDFRGFSGKEILKTEIQSALNKRLQGIEVQRVFLIDLRIL